MYENFYSLKQAPFRELSDPGLIFLSEKLKLTLINLLNCFRNHNGHVLLLGEEGAGKSIYAQTVVKNLTPNTLCAYLSHPIEHSEQLVMNICQAFEVHRNGMNSKTGYVMRLHALMDQLSAQKQHAVLIVDNAQTLKEEILEEIHLLMEYEPAKGQCLQFCLIGRPELQQVLNKPHFHHLNLMLDQRFHLNRLGPEETNAYIKHRLHEAGYEMVGDLFNSAAVQTIYAYTRGVPRQINHLSERALILASERGLNEIDAQLIHDAHAMAQDGRRAKPLVGEENATSPKGRQNSSNQHWLDDPATVQHETISRVSTQNATVATAADLQPEHEQQIDQRASGESDRFFQPARRHEAVSAQQTESKAQSAPEAQPGARQASKNISISNRVLETIISRTQRRVERYFRDKYFLIKKPEPGMWLPLIFVFLLSYILLFLLTAAFLKKFNIF